MFESDCARVVGLGLENRQSLAAHNRIRFANRSESSVYRRGVAGTERATTPHVSLSSIRIVNPPDARRSTVSPEHAKRWLKRGLATWVTVGTLLRLSQPLRRRMLGKSGASVPGVEYDAIKRQMSTEERQHIPISQPPPRVTKRKIGEGDSQWRPKRLVAAHAGGDRRLRQVSAGELTPSTPYPPSLGPSRGKSREG